MIIACIVLSACLTSAASGQAPGCRDRSDQVVYAIGSLPLDAKPVRILAMKVQPGGDSLLTIIVDGQMYGIPSSGKHWELLSGAKWDFIRYFPDVLVAPSDPHIAYGYESIGVIKRTTDGGRNWTVPSPLIDGMHGKDFAFRVSGDPEYVAEFHIAAIHPQKPLTLYATITVGHRRGPEANFDKDYPLPKLYVSADGGENWTAFTDKVGPFNEPKSGVVLGIDATDPLVMLGEGRQGIVQSLDGGHSWQAVGESDWLNSEPLDSEETARGVSPTRKWRLIPKHFVFDPVSSRILYIVSANGVHRSLDGGATWVLLNLGFDQFNAVNSFVIDPLQTNRVFAGTDRGLFVSDDRGCSFTKVPLPSSSAEAARH
jgi:hypothetical protein